jgi:uncharacterized protein (TIGR00730 family)
MQRLCVFCGASPGHRPEYLAAAADFGRLLAGRGIGLVYGGASVGLMGALADAALEAGGEVVGVIPQAVVRREIAHRGLSALHVVDTMHQRKALMAELSDAFVALPGGIGTLEEFFETWTWRYLGIHDKPFGILDVGGFYAPLATFLDHANQEGFLREQTRQMVVVDDDPVRLLERMEVKA